MRSSHVALHVVTLLSPDQEKRYINTPVHITSNSLKTNTTALKVPFFLEGGQTLIITLWRDYNHLFRFIYAKTNSKKPKKKNHLLAIALVLRRARTALALALVLRMVLLDIRLDRDRDV